jgi:hypothetical protein
MSPPSARPYPEAAGRGERSSAHLSPQEQVQENRFHPQLRENKQLQRFRGCVDSETLQLPPELCHGTEAPFN